MTRMNIKVLESNKEIAMRIGSALLPDVKLYMQGCVKNIKQGLPPLLYAAIINSPEYASVLGGQLRYELGIPNPSQVLSGLLNIWTSNLFVTYVPPVVSSNGRIKSSISANMVKVDFSDVLGSEYASIYDTGRGYTLPWLKWLLLDGSAAIIKNHSVVIGPNSRSRTGMAVMRETSKSWGVPKQFAGTESDNWITRSIDLYREEIEKFIEKATRL